MDDASSILHHQRVYYRNGVHEEPLCTTAPLPPPMYPHGDDPCAVPPRPPRHRHGSTKHPEATRETAAEKDDAIVLEEWKKAAEKFNELEKALPASDLPAGFPEDFAFRALAVYATLRTLSIQLRLSPFTPHAFLRALYFPYPNRLLGSVHVHILRVLLSNLRMGYHWKEASTAPSLEVVKKRKIDGIKWPLRAGDNFLYLDMYTWPLFYDDYCHLTADVHYASLFDETDFFDWRSVNLNNVVDQKQFIDDFVDDEVVDSDEEYIDDAWSDDASFDRPKKKQRGRSKAKKDSAAKRGRPKQNEREVSGANHSSRKTQLAASNPKSHMVQQVPHASYPPNPSKDMQQVPHASYRSNLSKDMQQVPHASYRSSLPKEMQQVPHALYRPILPKDMQQGPHASYKPIPPKDFDQKYVYKNFERLQKLYRNNEQSSVAKAGASDDRRPPNPEFRSTYYGSEVQRQHSHSHRNPDFITFRNNPTQHRSLPDAHLRNSNRRFYSQPSSNMQFHPEHTLPDLADTNEISAPLSQMQRMSPEPVTGPNVPPPHDDQIRRSYFYGPGYNEYGQSPPTHRHRIQSYHCNYESNPANANIDPNAGYGPYYGVNHYREGPPTLNSQQNAVVLKKSMASGVSPAVYSSIAALRQNIAQQEHAKEIFGTVEKPIEISDNDFDDEIVCKLQDDTFDKRNYQFNVSYTGSATNPVYSQPFPSVASWDELVPNEKSSISPVIEMKSSEVGLGIPLRKRKYAVLDAECKDSAEPEIDVMADACIIGTPKFYDVEYVVIKRVSQRCDSSLPVNVPNNETANAASVANLSSPLSNQYSDVGCRIGSSYDTQIMPLVTERLDNHVEPTSSGLVGGTSAVDNGTLNPPKSIVSMRSSALINQYSGDGCGIGSSYIARVMPSMTQRRENHFEALSHSVLVGGVTSIESDSLVPPKSIVNDTSKTTNIEMSLDNKNAANSSAISTVPFIAACGSFTEKGMPQNHGCPLRPINTTDLETHGKLSAVEERRAKSIACVSSKRSLTDSLRAFICGKQNSPEVYFGEVDEPVYKLDDDFDPFEVNEPDHWSHFYPLKSLRNGVPYHSLSIPDKLEILEFLVDELLSVDWIAAVFSERYNKLACSDYLYESKPSEADIKALRDADGEDHEDTCAVCKDDGNVVCCDGCVSVYHKECAGLSPSRDPPDIWFCPECECNDPSAFGPLRGGQKSEVDWVVVGDFFVSSLLPTLDKPKRALFESKLLAVHGFVFRQSTSGACAFLTDSRVVKSATYPVLSAEQLQGILSPLGQHFSSKWPIKQVPVNCSVMWGTRSDPEAKYFEKKESFDPSLYDNLYRFAPILLEGIQKGNKSREFECCIFSAAATSNLSDFIFPDMANDRLLVDKLRSTTTIFDALQVVKSAFLKMENDLMKASLLDEFQKRKRNAAFCWKESVKRSTSVRRLALLLLQLVDATHIRAFKAGWTHSAVVWAIEAEGKSRRRVDFKKEKDSVQEEALRRHWERGQLNHWTYLVETSSRYIPGFKKALCRRPTGTKRKAVGKVQLGSSHANEYITNNVDLQAAGNKSNQTEQSFTENYDTVHACAAEDEKKVPKRRRLDNYSNLLISASFPLNINPSLEDEMQMKLTSFSLEATSKLSNLREVHWPGAGKKLFDPVGYLCPPVVRRLGRTGGTLFAPFVEYFSLHEVGQVAFIHVWRKRLLQCSSFEELIKLFRIFESYLDKKTISQSVSFSNLYELLGGKCKTNQILCTQRDLLTGCDFYLVEGGGGKPNRWVSCLEIDLQTLIFERKRRVSRQPCENESKQKNSPGVSKPEISSKKLGEGDLVASIDPERQDITHRASRVVADHIIEVQKLIRLFGKTGIPENVRTKLRNRSDKRLQKVFVGKFSNVSLAQRFEMIRKAEQSAFEKTLDSGTSTSLDGTVTLAVPATTVGASESLENDAEAGLVTSEAPVAAVFDPSENANMSADPSKASTNDSNLSESISASISPALGALLSSGTPCDWSKHIIAEHKEFIRSVYCKYDYKCLPENEIELSRKRCLGALMAIFQLSRIRYSALQTSALIKEAENEVLNEYRESLVDFGRILDTGSTSINKSPFFGHGVPPREEYPAVTLHVQQIHGTQTNAGRFSNTILSRDSQSAMGAIPSYVAPCQYESFSSLTSPLQQPSGLHFSTQYAGQVPQNGSVLSTQHWQNSSTLHYLAENGAYMSQQGPPFTFNSQLNQNGSQQQQWQSPSEFRDSGERNDRYFPANNYTL